MERFRYIFEHANIGIAICNAETRKLEKVNTIFAQIHGYEAHELIGQSAAEMFSPQCLARTSEVACEMGSECFCDDTSFETVHKRKDGSDVPVSVHIAVIKDQNDVITYRIINLIDISKRKIVENELIQTTRRITALFNTIPDLIWMKNPEGIYLTCNHAFASFFGISESELIGKTDYDIIDRDMAEFFRTKDQEAIAKGDVSVNEETLVSRETGLLTTLLTRKVPVFSSKNELMGVLGFAKDITEQKKSERQIEHLYYYDSLTDLPNWVYAKTQTKAMLERCVQKHCEAALMLIDLDDFKAVNKTFGHSLGDAMLQAVGKKLQKQLGEHDILCRLGGDEFLVMLMNLKYFDAFEMILENIFNEFEAPFLVDEHLFSMSLSVGVAGYPEHGDTFEVLMQKADTALHQTKEDGGGGYSVFNETMRHDMSSHFSTLNNLRAAYAQKQFLLYYQPQVCLKTNEIIGAEALIRWKHPTMGMVPPMQFIPVAETSSLIVPIGEWIIDEACRQGAQWHKDGIKIRIAVNISAIQFRRGDLVGTVKDALAASGMDPTFLELELTETIMMSDTQKTLEIITQLKALGIRLSIDDFGTGYSSLAYLKRFAIDKLKIDRSFITDLISNKEDAVIVNTIIQMAENLNLETIAEGVENREVLELLRHYGCHAVQGYHLAKPMPSTELRAFVKRFRDTKSA